MSVDHILPYILRHHFEAFNIFKIYMIKFVHQIVFSSSFYGDQKVISFYSFGGTDGELN